jgi:hypothetical protein
MASITIGQDACLLVGDSCRHPSLQVGTLNVDGPWIYSQRCAFKVGADVENHIDFAPLNATLGLCGRNPIGRIGRIEIGLTNHEYDEGEETEKEEGTDD